MEYTKQTWIAPTGTGLSRYAKSGETDTHIELALDPVNLTNTPTPITVARLNHMEDGISEADKAQNLAPDAIMHYSFDEIKQIPDDPSGTVYLRDNDWTTTDGWGQGHPSIALSVENSMLKIVYDGTRPDIGISMSKNGVAYNNKFIVGKIKSTVPIISVRYYNGTVSAYLKLNKTNSYETVFYGYITSTEPSLILYINQGQLTAKTCWLESFYVGDGSYLDPVIDNSYSLAHAENHGVIPVDGVCGKAGYFNNSYMIAPRPSLADDITIYFWAKFDTLGSTIVQSRAIADITGLNVFVGTNGYGLNWGGISGYFTAYVVPVNEWHHVTIKSNQTTRQLKINNVLVATETGVYTNHTNFNTTIAIGKSIVPEGSRLFGSLDGLQIIPRFTTDDEDTANYKARGNLPKVGKDIIGDLIGTASKANVRVSLRHGNTWFDKTWTGLTEFTGADIWTDGDNIYYSYGINQFVLSKATSELVAKTWTGLTDIIGSSIWTDGENIYYSNSTTQFVLNKTTSTWTVKTWTGLTDFIGSSIWTDGENIYYSNSTTQFVLNKTTSTWTVKTWTGITNFTGNRIWTDGENIYYSLGTTQYVLNKAISTWVDKTWTGLTSFNGSYIWTDGDNIYYSSTTTHFVLNKLTATWTAKTWTGLTSFNGSYIWTDGDNIYHSSGTPQYVLPATRHNYVDDNKYNSLFGTVTKCVCSTLSDRFVFRNE